MSEKAWKYQRELDDFRKHFRSYRPFDLFDFYNEYFDCLKRGVRKSLPQKSVVDLSKFHLSPEDEKVVKRLNIPVEDLVRVQNRRKVKTHEQILEEINSEFDKYIKILENSDELNEQEMHNYLKLKNNIFRDNEFLRFLKEIEKLPINKTIIGFFLLNSMICQKKIKI